MMIIIKLIIITIITILIIMIKILIIFALRSRAKGREPTTLAS